MPCLREHRAPCSAGRAMLAPSPHTCDEPPPGSQCGRQRGDKHAHAPRPRRHASAGQHPLHVIEQALAGHQCLLSPIGRRESGRVHRLSADDERVLRRLDEPLRSATYLLLGRSRPPVRARASGEPDAHSFRCAGVMDFDIAAATGAIARWPTISRTSAVSQTYWALRRSRQKTSRQRGDC